MSDESGGKEKKKVKLRLWHSFFCRICLSFTGKDGIRFLDALPGNTRESVVRKCFQARGASPKNEENETKFFRHRHFIIIRRKKQVAVKGTLRIKLKSYEHNLIDQSAQHIVDAAKRTGARVSGPIPLPTEKEIVTILRSPHKYKDSREQFERRTHKRLIDIINPTPKTVDAMMKLELPAGVEIEMKL